MSLNGVVSGIRAGFSSRPAQVALDVAAVAGGGAAITELAWDKFSDGTIGNQPVADNLVLGVGAGALALRGLQRVPTMNVVARRWALGGLVAAGIGAAGIVAAPVASANTKKSDQNYKNGSLDPDAGGYARPAYKPSTRGIAAPAYKAKVVDWTKWTKKKTPTGHTVWTASAHRAKWPHAKPNFIFLHGTGGGKPGGTKKATAKSYLEIFSDPNRPASIHYVVDRSGQIVQYVNDRDEATHIAGDGVAWNSASIGIEMVNDNSSKDPYTPAQLEATRNLVQTLSHEYDVPIDHVMMHKQVQDNRGDPAGFDWHGFLNVLDDTEPIGDRVQQVLGKDIEDNSAEHSVEKSKSMPASEKQKLFGTDGGGPAAGSEEADESDAPGDQEGMDDFAEAGADVEKAADANSAPGLMQAIGGLFTGGSGSPEAAPAESTPASNAVADAFDNFMSAFGQ